MLKRKIFAFICTALVCILCGCSDDEKTIAEIEPSAVTETLETMTVTANVTETEETSPNTKSLTISQSGYVLDPSVTLKKGDWAYEFAENQPCFIDETPEGVRVYGVNTDIEREYHYIDHAMDEELFSLKTCVVLEHDGTAEEFAGKWGERFGTAMTVYSGDYDGDGEIEIATDRYDTGGSFCSINELVLYKLKDGRYQQFVFYPNEFNDEYIILDIDSENKSLIISVKGFDETFTYDFAEVVPPEMTDYEVDMLSNINFIFDSGEITYEICPLLYSYSPMRFVDIKFRLDFFEGKFICTSVEFDESQI